MNQFKNFTAGFIRENPVFALYLGICSTLAITQNLNNALGMGVSVIFVLVCSNVMIAAIRKIIPDEIRIPVFIVIIATFVTIVEMLINAFAPSLASSLGTFIALIVVNCIILGRAEAFAYTNTVLSSLLDGIGMGLGYTASLVLMSGIRELIATGGWTITNPFTEEVVAQLMIIPQEFTISMFSQPVGAFLTFGLLGALFAYLNTPKTKKVGGTK
jgi:Na+-translocating ferredoxin:NAD+ oxidoreductase subunit E